jgi:hypothetical protein
MVGTASATVSGRSRLRTSEYLEITEISNLFHGGRLCRSDVRRVVGQITSSEYLVKLILDLLVPCSFHRQSLVQKSGYFFVRCIDRLHALVGVGNVGFDIRTWIPRIRNLTVKVQQALVGPWLTSMDDYHMDLRIQYHGASDMESVACLR